MSKIKLYHYTDASGANGIKSSGKIKGSTDDTPTKHCRFGKGVYLTSIDPQNDPKSILRNNYDDRGFVANSKRLWAKIEYVVEIVLPVNEVNKVQGCNRDVYLYDGDIILDKYPGSKICKIYKNPNPIKKHGVKNDFF